MRKPTTLPSEDIGQYEPAERSIMLAALLIAIGLFILSVLLSR